MVDLTAIELRTLAYMYTTENSMPIWNSRSKGPIEMSEMNDAHLENAIKWQARHMDELIHFGLADSVTWGKENRKLNELEFEKIKRANKRRRDAWKQARHAIHYGLYQPDKWVIDLESDASLGDMLRAAVTKEPITIKVKKEKKPVSEAQTPDMISYHETWHDLNTCSLALIHKIRKWEQDNIAHHSRRLQQLDAAIIRRIPKVGNHIGLTVDGVTGELCVAHDAEGRRWQLVDML